MKSYLLIGVTGVAAASVTYDDAELLKEIKFIDNPEYKVRAWLMKRVPVASADLKNLQAEKVGLIEVSPDLSFESFWNLYNYKVGKKERAKGLWDKLSEEDKLKAMYTIPKYKRWLTTKNIEMLYPETFLSQRRFESEFKS